MLAQLLASQQVLGGCIQIVAFTEELAHAHVHVRRSPQHGRALRRRELQSPLVGAHCLAETALRDPYIGQHDRATDRIGGVPGLLQARHAIGIRPVRRLEVPARPGGEPQKPRRPSAGQMVVLGCDLERPPSVRHGPWHIATGQGQSGTGDRDLTR